DPKKGTRRSDPVTSGDVITVPSRERGTALFLDDNLGVEHFFAVMSAERWTALEEELARSHTHPSKPPAAKPAPVLDFLAIQTRGVGGEKRLEGPAPLDGEAVEGRIMPEAIPWTEYRAMGSFLVAVRWCRHVAR